MISLITMELITNNYWTSIRRIEKVAFSILILLSYILLILLYHIPFIILILIPAFTIVLFIVSVVHYFEYDSISDTPICYFFRNAIINKKGRKRTVAVAMLTVFEILLINLWRL